METGIDQCCCQAFEDLETFLSGMETLTLTISMESAPLLETFLSRMETPTVPACGSCARLP